MSLAKQHISLMYDIQNRHTHTKIGEVKILIHKETEMDKWKNPNNYKHQALDLWVDEHPEWFKSDLDAFYTGDLIPSV
jgi:hypothetical protein